MRKTVSVVQKTVLFISALVLVAGYPTTAMATSEELVTDPEPLTTEQTSSTVKSEKQEPTYTYDPVTKKWNSEQWQWNPETNSYERPQQPIIVEPEPSLLSEQGNQNGEIAEEAEQTAEKTIDTDVDVNNTVASDAVSGDATVSGNTEAGSASSGDAEVVANIINSVNSSVATGDNQKIATFTKDLYGDVEGDIILYPMLLKAMLEQEAQGADTTDIHATTDFAINNDITLNAETGDATVKNNTKAGDATSGNATAMANVINILNSLIATQDSFIGTINIYGSLEGDILIAPDFIPQMLANNGGGDEASGTKLSTKDTTTIVNNISAVAESGAASVFGNTTGGNATTGKATSNVVIFNVTGRDIVAENSMLVFVNVLGKWVGMIVDAPAGATAAMIGSGVTSDGAHVPDLTLESESRHGITNTVAVNATTGDAAVRNNTTGGNATSGDAHAFANIANVSNSSLSLAGWFGLLFINITGDWFGSFQVDTDYGNKPEEPITKPTGPVQFVPSGGGSVQNVRANAARVIVDSRYLATMASATTDTSTEAEPEMSGADTTEAEVLGDTDTSSTSDTEEAANYWFLIVAGSIILIGSSVLGIRRLTA